MKRLLMAALVCALVVSLDAQSRIRLRSVAPVSEPPPTDGVFEDGTLRSASCSSSSLNNAISTAVTGDVVQLQAGCTPFSASITMPSGTPKGLLIDLNGNTFTSLSIEMWPHATMPTRITGFTAPCSSFGIEPKGDTLTGAKWRLDHFTMTGVITSCLNMRLAPGVIDNCNFPNLNGSATAHEFIHVDGLNGTGSTGWTTALTPGDDNSVYIETCTFTITGSLFENWLQAYWGGRWVFRFNTNVQLALDNHGTAGGIGGRWFEVYNNSFASGAPGTNMRAGGGLEFNNTGSGALKHCEEDSGYPALYQVGRGQNQVLYPVYTFNNSQGAEVGDSCEADGVLNMVLFNRDIFDDNVSASCTAGGSCTQGVGVGTPLPTSCTTNVGGITGASVAFWKTDEGGNWDTTNGTANDGMLYKCTSADTWTPYYTPLAYPHPLIAQTTDSRVD